MSHDAEPRSSQGLPLADPTPIGLICLAIGCAALVPIAFLVNIDLRYIARIARHLGGGGWLGVVIGICTVGLGAISLWIAFALLINPVAGRAVFAFPGPVSRPRSVRRVP